MLNEVFKTYAKGDGKKCVDKHKGIENVRTYEEVQEFKSYGGILQKDFVDISFDSEELSEMFMKMCEQEQWNCLVIENPENKHIHSYWKDTEHKIEKKGYVDVPVAVGLVADIHSGSTYIPLKVDGTTREVIFDKEPSEPYQQVPDELLPVKTDINLLELAEGEGRNENLFRYIPVLQSQLQFDVEQIRSVLKNTNNFIFKEPLSEKEFDTITRDESFCKPIFYNGKTFLHNVFGDYLIKEHHIRRFNGSLFCYRDGIYIYGYKYIENLMLSEIPSIKANQRNEVLKYLEVKLPDNEDVTTQEKFIAFRNGILDFTTGELLPFNPEYLVTNKIPWDYNPVAYSKLMDDTLNKIACDNAGIRMVLEECVGYCMYRKNILSKSFFLTGSGSNGKSTFLESLKYMLGIRNVSSLELDDLGDRFSTVMMIGKLANIGDDISNQSIQGKTLSTFKKIITSNTIKAENKGVDAIDFKPYTKLLFSANEIPKMATGGFDAIKRRLVIIPFNAKFSKEDSDFNPNIEYDLKTAESMEYLIQLGISGLKRALENKGFTEPEQVTEELNEFEKENNPLVSWLEEVSEEDILNHSVRDVYMRFDMFCTENGFDNISQPKFTKIIKKQFDVDTQPRNLPDAITGKKKSVRVFIPVK